MFVLRDAGFKCEVFGRRVHSPTSRRSCFVVCTRARIVFPPRSEETARSCRLVLLRTRMSHLPPREPAAPAARLASYSPRSSPNPQVPHVQQNSVIMRRRTRHMHVEPQGARSTCMAWLSSVPGPLPESRLTSPAEHKSSDAFLMIS